MNTHETYVSLETAQLLKEAGFDWDCLGVWVEGKFSIWYEPKSNVWWKGQKEVYSASTLAVAQKWLREVKNIQIIASSLAGSKKWTPLITKDFLLLHEDISGVALTHENFDTYEEALEAGINKCLTLLFLRLL